MKKLLYLFIIFILSGCTIYIGDSDKPKDNVAIENKDKSKKSESESESEKENVRKYFDMEYICRGWLDGIIKDKNTGNLYFVHRGTYGISINPILKEDGKPLNLKDYEK